MIVSVFEDQLCADVRGLCKMDWNIGNPAEALKNYYEEYPRFLQAKGLSESRQAELAAKTTELAQQKRKLQKGQETLEQMGSYTPADVQTQTTEVQNRAEEKSVRHSRRMMRTKKHWNGTGISRSRTTTPAWPSV